MREPFSAVIPGIHQFSQVLRVLFPSFNGVLLYCPYPTGHNEATVILLPQISIGCPHYSLVIYCSILWP